MHAHTLQGRRYTGRDYLVVAMIVVGLVVFMHADVHTASSSDIRGVSLITIALCIDAAITNLQVRSNTTVTAAVVQLRCSDILVQVWYTSVSKTNTTCTAVCSSVCSQ
jgi:drug/metabolite transporter (DMT)-like permease